MSNKPTGERLEFSEFSNVTIEHLHRYALANDFITDKNVLDIASGEGYGSFILSKRAKLVIGVDIDIETIENAKIKYVSNNLQFIQGSAANIPIADNTIDVVVSFETIEHHDMHDEMMMEIKRVLKKDGILIMSSPDKEYYCDKIGQNNLFHVKELYFEQFKELTNNYFKHSTFLFQKCYNFNSYIANESNFDIDIYSGDNKNFTKEKIEPLYNIVLASNETELTNKPSFFNGSMMTDFFIKKAMNDIKIEHYNHIYNTSSYKIGNLICYPFFLIKKILKRLKL